MTAEARREIIKNSVQRLSKPKNANAGVCRKANSERSTPLSPYPLTGDDTTVVIEPSTPFEPIDPSRMMFPDVSKSCTARRVPQPRIPRNLSSRQTLFSNGNDKTPEHVRTNLLKRAGDYKPNKDAGEATHALEPKILSEAMTSALTDAPTVAINELSLIEGSLTVPPPPPPTAADTSCIVSSE
ncbi:unnamed protein product [Strongylus vulgaris]|uniref:Uncharacterized protein n=1 Tax=Strongylus vulgaris TaxID=40348 RepID=A0A3P7JAT6_STRVU|nr:unnamed protein product [Strongylus vulgaris]